MTETSFDLKDLAAIVVATLSADTVRKLWLMTLRALAHRRFAQLVVRPARISVRFGCFSLWNGHYRIFFFGNTSHKGYSTKEVESS